MQNHRLPGIIIELYKLVDELESLYPGRYFTLDGHLVGSIGEVVAQLFYDLDLLVAGEPGRDATTKDGTNRSVQIKLTAGDSVNIADCDFQPDILIVLQIQRSRGFREAFNGSYPADALNQIKSNKRRVKVISLARLASEQKKVSRALDDSGRISELNAQFARDTA
jgi:hypothetical protein